MRNFYLLLTMKKLITDDRFCYVYFRRVIWKQLNSLLYFLTFVRQTLFINDSECLEEKKNLNNVVYKLETKHPNFTLKSIKLSSFVIRTLRKTVILFLPYIRTTKMYGQLWVRLVKRMLCLQRNKRQNARWKRVVSL